MLTFERVFETFASFLSEDMATEVVKVVHGYIVMFWDKERSDYDFFTLCRTPHALMRELVKSYGSYLSWLLCQKKEDITAKEKAEIVRKQKAIRAECLNSSK